MNDIEKSFKIEPTNDKNDTPEGSWTSVLGPWGSWISLLGRFASHVAPQSPQVKFLRILEIIWDVIWTSKSVNFGVYFRCVSGMFFGWVLEWCWGCFG